MAVKITIIGKVHDVGYRLFLLEEADYLFIPYFDARNVKIDDKEALIVLVDGDEEQIKEFVEFVKTNKPENAVVEEIRIEEYRGRVRDIERFRASFNTAQLSKIVQVGLKMLEKQDVMIQKQDLMLQKQDQMLQKQDETIKVIKEESERTRGEIKELRMDLKSYLDERLKKIESEIEKIKAKLGMP